MDINLKKAFSQVSGTATVSKKSKIMIREFLTLEVVRSVWFYSWANVFRVNRGSCLCTIFVCSSLILLSPMSFSWLLKRVSKGFLLWKSWNKFRLMIQRKLQIRDASIFFRNGSNKRPFDENSVKTLFLGSNCTQSDLKRFWGLFISLE